MASQSKSLVNQTPNQIAQNDVTTQSQQNPIDLNKLKIKLVKKNKDGSETYLVNGKKLTVSKKQIQQTYQAYMKNNSDKGVNPQFVQYVGGVAVAVAYLQAYAQVYGLTAGLFIANACSVRPDNCAKTLMGAYQGAGWAKTQVLQWAKGR